MPIFFRLTEENIQDWIAGINTWAAGRLFDIEAKYADHPEWDWGRYNRHIEATEKLPGLIEVSISDTGRSFGAAVEIGPRGADLIALSETRLGIISDFNDVSLTITVEVSDVSHL